MIQPQRVVWITVTTEPPELPTDIVMDSFPACGYNTALVDVRVARVGTGDQSFESSVDFLNRITACIEFEPEPIPPQEPDL